MLDFFVCLACLLLCSPDVAASPVKRYTNSTIAPADCPDESKTTTATSTSSSSTALYVGGPTTLATSLLSPQAPSQGSSPQAQAVQTAPISFTYAPLPYNTSTTATYTGLPSQGGYKPSSLWGTTLTTYTTVTSGSETTTTSTNGVQAGLGSVPSSGTTRPRFSYASFPYWTSRPSSSSSVLPITGTANTQPYFSTSTSTFAATTSPSATAYVPDLPDVVTASSASSSATSTSSEVAGITIIPLTPSVVYLPTTVTDAGATTTVGSATVTVTVTA